jgi:hypothetical protein
MPGHPADHAQGLSAAREPSQARLDRQLCEARVTVARVVREQLDRQQRRVQTSPSDRGGR